MITTFCDNVSSLNNAVAKGSLDVRLIGNGLTLGLIDILLRKRMVSDIIESTGRHVRVRLRKGLHFKIRMLTKPSRHVYMGFKELNGKSFGNGYWVLSTCAGRLMDSYECLDKRMGGLVLCRVHFPNR